MPDLLTYSTFKTLLGSKFTLRALAECPEGKEELVLMEAEKLPQRSAGNSAGSREPFSLVFRGPAGISLPQQIHVMEHETLGVMEIFLVPIAPDAAGLRYEAVFN